MKKFPTEKEIQEFDQLVHKAAELHTFTWCVKQQCLRDTAGLNGRECLNCPEFVVKGGACDPL